MTVKSYYTKDSTKNFLFIHFQNRYDLCSGNVHDALICLRCFLWRWGKNQFPDGVLHFSRKQPGQSSCAL